LFRYICIEHSALMATADESSGEHIPRLSVGRLQSGASRLEYYDKPSFDNDIAWKNPQRRRSSRHVLIRHDPGDENNVDTLSSGVDNDDKNLVFAGRPSEVKDERWRDDVGTLLIIFIISILIIKVLLLLLLCHIIIIIIIIIQFIEKYWTRKQ